MSTTKKINTINVSNSIPVSFTQLMNSPKIDAPVLFNLPTQKNLENIYVCWPKDYATTISISLELFTCLFSTGEKYIEIFGADIVTKALKLLSIKDLVDEEKSTREQLNSQLYCGCGVLVGNRSETMYFTHYKGEWQKEEKEQGYKVLFPAHYQNWEKNFLHYCLLAKFPYLAEFDVTCYHLNDGINTDIYISVNDEDHKNSITCPIKAFVEGDFNIIKERHESYYTNYYRWPGGWGNNVTKEDILNKRNHMIQGLVSPTILRLKKLMENHNKGVDYHPSVLAKLTVDNVYPDPTKKLKFNQRFIIYGNTNGMANKPVIHKTFEEGLKHLVTVFTEVHPKKIVLRNMFYKDVINDNPEHFSVNYETGTATLSYSNNYWNCAFTMEIIDI